MTRIVLHSNVANLNEFVDPMSNFGKDVTQNNGVLFRSYSNRPLLRNAFISLLLDSR